MSPVVSKQWLRGKLMRGRILYRSVGRYFREPDAPMIFRSFRTSRLLPRIIAMQTLVAASFAAKAQECPNWVKSAARAAFVLCVIKGSVWLGATWLAFRGINGL